MGKHETGYARSPRDFYPSPTWVTEALLEHVDVRGKTIWECACGTGAMSEPLKRAGAHVFSSDIVSAYAEAIIDFLSDHPGVKCDGCVTNPPFGVGARTAVAFIEKGLARMGDEGFLTLLLPVDFDSAKTRVHLFGSCPLFRGKIVLTKRAKWFENPDNPKAAPKENSAWYLWGNVEPFARFPTPIIQYAPGVHQCRSLKRAT